MKKKNENLDLQVTENLSNINNPLIAYYSIH